MTQLEKVQYTAKAHTTGARVDASCSDDGRPAVRVSSAGILGTGTAPEVHHSSKAKFVLPPNRMIVSADTVPVHQGVIGSEPD